MNPFDEYVRYETRRQFFGRGANAVGWAALASLLGPSAGAASRAATDGRRRGGRAAGLTALRPQGEAGHLPAHGRRPVADGPVRLQAEDGRVVRQGPARLGPHGPAAHDDDLAARRGSRSPRRSTSSPSTARAACGSASCCRTRRKMVDDMCFIRSMHTEAINHEPAITLHADRQPDHRPALPRRRGSSYGLGSLNENLPTFVVLVAKPTQHRAGPGDLGPALVVGLPARASTPGVSFRSGGDPILYINNPPGVAAEVRRQHARRPQGAQRDELPGRRRPRDAHPHRAVRAGLPDAVERARADRHRAASPSRPTSSTATTAKKPGTFAHTALLARRMVERGVRFVQIYHNNWDTHGNVAGRLPDQCKDVDQPCWGLIQDLKQRGLLDETLVIWGGEFGRTIYSQGGLTQRQLRPRPPPALLHDVDGRRRLAGRARSTARPTTSPTTSSRTRSTSATSTPRSCTCSASTTSGSPTATRASTSS